MRFDQHVEQELRSIGWTPGRREHDQVAEWKEWARSRGIPIHPRAEVALLEFGALHYIGGAPGVDLATQSFIIDPRCCEGAEDLVETAAEDVGEEVSPLGRFADGKAVLVMGESGIVYAVGDFDEVVGSSIDDALRRLILGIRWDGHAPGAWTED